MIEKRIEKIETQIEQLRKSIIDTNRRLHHIVPTYHKRYFCGGKWVTKRITIEELLKETGG